VNLGCRSETCCTRLARNAERKKLPKSRYLPTIVQLCRATYSQLVAPSVQHRKVWLTPTTRVPCSNAAKTWNPLKLAGVPQTPEPISAASGPKFAILWEHEEKILLFNKFYPIVNKCLSCEYMARQSCTIVRRWRIFGDFFASCISSESRAPHFRPAF